MRGAINAALVALVLCGIAISIDRWINDGAPISPALVDFLLRLLGLAMIAFVAALLNAVGERD